MKQTGREGNDNAVTHSSIALLQERFKQLQRVKEMREEQESSKLARQPREPPDRTPGYQQQYANPPLVLGEPRLHQHSPPRAPFSHYQRVEIPLLADSTSSSGPNPNRDVSDKCTQAYDCDDVDTSLHL